MSQKSLTSKNKVIIEDIVNSACTRFDFIKESTFYRITEQLKENLIRELISKDYWSIVKNESEMTDILTSFKSFINHLIDNEAILLAKVILQYRYEKDQAVDLVWPYRSNYFVNGCIQSLDSEHFLNMHLKEVFQNGFEQFLANRELYRNKMIKKLYHSLLDFLVLIEDLQIAFFEKKKIVRETHYCITLDKVPEEFYPEILNNKKQIEEWLDIYKLESFEEFEQIDEDFLRSHPSMMLDTKHFSEKFKDRLLSKFENVHENLDGIVIHGDNFDGLRLLQETFAGKIKLTYIDPPYNRGKDEFRYKDNYQHSSWLCLMESLFKEHKKLCGEDSVIFISIDDAERPYLESFISSYFKRDPRFGPIIVQANKGGRDYLPIAKQHEYILCYYTGETIPEINLLARDESEFKFKDSRGKWLNRELRNRNPRFNRSNRPNLFYPFYINPSSIDDDGFCTVSLEKTDTHSIEIFPRDSKGRDDCWRWGKEKSQSNLDSNNTKKSNIVARQRPDGGWNIYEKYRNKGRKAKSIWFESEFRTENGTIQLRKLFGRSVIDFPKPVELIQQCIHLGSSPGDYVLDFFAGSGTTAHAVINLNRKDRGNRKYILIEKEKYVDSVLVPRIKKVVFSPEWKKGVPQTSYPFSHMFKYVKIETYCESLGNLSLNSPMPNNRVSDSLFYLLRINKDSFSISFPTPFFKNTFCDVDLVETFNWILGMKLGNFETYNNGGTYYKVIRGKSANQKVVIIWRNTKDLDMEQDAEFIQQTILTSKVDRVYINSRHKIPNALLIESILQEKMFAITRNTLKKV
ncbi:MAG: site-specific DNA-methyltransferase [Candidatus Hodarchaeales archaeon]